MPVCKTPSSLRSQCHSDDLTEPLPPHPQFPPCLPLPCPLSFPDSQQVAISGILPRNLVNQCYGNFILAHRAITSLIRSQPGGKGLNTTASAGDPYPRGRANEASCGTRAFVHPLVYIHAPLPDSLLANPFLSSPDLLTWKHRTTFSGKAVTPPSAFCSRSGVFQKGETDRKCEFSSSCTSVPSC